MFANNPKQLKTKINKYKIQESAFRETLAEADIYMVNLENKYKDDISFKEKEIKLLNHHLEEYRYILALRRRR